MPTKTKLKPVSKLAPINTIARDISKDPLVIKKRMQAKVVLEKYGFPKELRKR